MDVTDEQLGAFLDGECSDEEAARIAALLETDPVVAARLEAMSADTQLLRSAFDAVLLEPVPAALTAAVTPPAAEIVDFAAARASRQRRWVQPMAMAASIAFGVVVGAVGFNGGSGTEDGRLIIASSNGPVAGTALAATLASARSGTQTAAGQAMIKPLISFRDADGRLCRQFDLTQQDASTGGIACADGANWQLVVLATRAAGPTGGYATAAGPGETAVMAALDGMIAGDPLDAAAEAQALKSLR